MSRTITVKVVDKDGYGLSGYSVKTYGGSVVKTNSDGKANLDCDSSEVTIYVDGVQKYKGYTSKCDNPLVVVR
ncbi:MAG: hypothetical protein NTZ64_18550 [Polaromonas sp.]|nr:hypothetical protein [Polaromonas sp.]